MDIRAARRYALALFEAAKAQQSVNEVGEDLNAIAQILEAKPELKTLLESPEIDRQRKLQLVDRLFADRARPLTMRLLRMLIGKNRQRELTGIRQEFVKAVEQSAGILRVQITSAVDLKADEVNKIVERIAQQTGKRIIPELHVDPSLIGGATAQYGDSVLDGSVKGALHRLREKLFIDILKQA